MCVIWWCCFGTSKVLYYQKNYNNKNGLIMHYHHDNDFDPYCLSQTEFEDDPQELSSYWHIGRIGRLRYWVYFWAMPAIGSMLQGIYFATVFVLNDSASIISVSDSQGTRIYMTGFILTTLAIVAQMMMFWSIFSGLHMTARRLNDVGRSGWWAFLLFVPVVNVAVWLFLLMVRGNQGENHAGIPAMPPSRTIKALALVLPILGVWGVSAIVRPEIYEPYVMMIKNTVEYVAGLYDIIYHA